MKNLKLLYSFLTLFSLLFSVRTQDSKIYHIMDCAINGTALPVNLGTVTGNYLYFSYDFIYHNWAHQEKRDVAYFHLSLDNDFIGSKPISYGFVEKNETDIKGVSEIENINWDQLDYSYKTNEKNEKYDYYYEIKRTNDKMNTLLLRLPLNGIKSGYIMPSNIEDFPDYIKQEPVQIRRNKGNIMKIKLFGLLLFLISIL